MMVLVWYAALRDAPLPPASVVGVHEALKKTGHCSHAQSHQHQKRRRESTHARASPLLPSRAAGLAKEEESDHSLKKNTRPPRILAPLFLHCHSA